MVAISRRVLIRLIYPQMRSSLLCIYLALCKMVESQNSLRGLRMLLIISSTRSCITIAKNQGIPYLRAMVEHPICKTVPFTHVILCFLQFVLLLHLFRAMALEEKPVSKPLFH
uniref:Uncharacterized protein n=1 Tax=Opuntia streptacantha TaxID=393608 RepID=A0A7C8YG63_OPUST